MKTQNAVGTKVGIMKSIKSAIAAGVLSLAAVMMASSGAYGQGVAPPLGGSVTSYPNIGGGWVIVDASGAPQVVVRDPTGQPWYKDLQPLPGQVVLPGSVFKVHEQLIVGGNLPWSDWHEQILTPGWEWLPSSALLANNVSAPGLTVTTTPGNISIGGSIDYTFNSLPPGTFVDITKSLIYSGAGLPVPPPPFFGPVRIAEFPTPEPATLSLLALGGIAMIRRRRGGIFRAAPRTEPSDVTPSGSGRRNLKTCSIAVIALLIAALAGPVAWGQGVGNVGSLPNVFQQTTAFPGWDLTGGTPLPVVRDPNGPKWVKHLVDPNGGPFVAQPGQTFPVHELLQIAGNLSWTDWHEEILTPGWQWVNPTSFLGNFTLPSNLVTTYQPPTTTSGGIVSFNFDPLAPGTLVDIRKTLQYVGTPGTVFVGTVEVAEYPTPEPATLSLLALGGLALLRRRRQAQ